MSQAGIDTAAVMIAFGLDGYKWLKTSDSLQQRVMVELFERVKEEKERQEHNLAVAIALQVSKLFKK